MARQLRIQYEGAIYHVFSRGHRGEKIFKEEKDKINFLEKMVGMVEKYNIIIHSYVLMPTHYHLLISTPQANLSNAMHQLNTSYANWFKSRYKIIGSIFQGRFKSVLVETEDYMLVLSAYIHLNPVRSGIVDKPEAYVWSSFPAYLPSVDSREKIEQKNRKSEKKQKWQKAKDKDNDEGKDKDEHRIVFPYLCTGDILEMFSGNRNSYRSFVYGWLNKEKDMDKEEIYGKYSIVGSEEFRKGILSQVGFSSSPHEIREKPELIYLRRFKADEIASIIGRIFKVSKEEIYSKKRGNDYKKLYMFAMRSFSELSLREIGELMGMDYSAVSQALRRFISASKKDKNLNAKIERLKQSLRRY